ncbi:MAG: DinB family protein [Pyrinomonadaceae bacterium]
MLKKNLEDYRRGAVGALMDEYERAAFELKSIVENVSGEDYTRIADAETKDEDCRAIQTMMNHVIHAGYGYANGIRRQFSMPFEPLGKERRQISNSEIGDEIDKVLAYTVETLEGRWELSYEEMEEIVITRKENFAENLEQLLEHAVLHIFRHRRQIEKFLLKFEG